jgi:uncharacterized membrane protein YbhN (UPF0104 family)
MSERTKKIYHRFLLIFSAMLLIGFVLYVQKNNASFEKMKTIDLSLIFLLMSIHALNYLLLGITHFYPLRKHNIFLKFKEWYGLCTVSELFNLLLPAKGGTAIRMMYINEKTGLAKREFLSMGLSVILTGFSLLGILGTVYCHYFLKKHNIVFEALESLFIALTVSSFLLIFATELISKVFKIKRKYSLKKYLSDKKIVLISILCYLGMFALYPLKVYLSFKATGIQIHFTDSLEISLILLVTSFFQILPGNIGIKEVATAYIAQQYGIQFEAALIASLVDRAILVLFLFPFGAYFYWDLFLGSPMPQIFTSARSPFMKINE